MAVFGKNRFPSKYQDGIGWDCTKGSSQKISDQLHRNSQELCAILEKNNILKDEMNVFEIGAGPARNLTYLYDSNNNINLFVNDLHRESSIENMRTDMKDIINFYEIDTLSLMENYKPEFHVDLMIASDHLMHVEYESVDRILKKMMNDWKPTHILFREVKKEFETPNHPRLFHDYNQLLSKYEIVEETESGDFNEFFIWLLRIK